MTRFESAIVSGDGKIDADASISIVPWWSFTKTLIAASVLLLAERHRLALDEKLPGLPYTPRELLRHRAGVGNYGGMPEYHAAVARGDLSWTDEELFARIPPDMLLFAPGADFAYSNVGYLVLRRLVERAHGTGLGDALRDLVLGPLDLHGSRLAEATGDMRSTRYDGGYGYDPGWVFHGTVIGPVAEAALALHRLLHWGLLSPTSLAALQDRKPTGGPIHGRPWRATGYGLGVMIGTMQGHGMTTPLHVIGHSAGGPGSVGAVYHAHRDGKRQTVAVFASAPDEGVVENEASRLLVHA